MDLNSIGKLPDSPNEGINKKVLLVETSEYKTKVNWMQKVVDYSPYIGYKSRFDTLYYLNTLARHTLCAPKQVMKLTKQQV